MPAYYFDMEGFKAGERPDPRVDKLITIQYQKIDLTTGKPLDKLHILKEWESSEKDILKKLYDQFFKPGIPVTQFIPVGLSLNYEYEMMISKLKKYNLGNLTSFDLYHSRPRFDIRSIIVLLNGGEFKGARLDCFSAKKCDGSPMKEWYANKQYDVIDQYIQEETDAFLNLLQHIIEHRRGLGLMKKAESNQQKPIQVRKAAPQHPKSGPASPSPAPQKQVTKKPPAGNTKPQPPRANNSGKPRSHNMKKRSGDPF